MKPLPPDFIRTVQGSFGGGGKRWLEALPASLEEVACRWDLVDIRPVPNLSYNFVAFARRGGGPGRPLEEAEVVLKLGVPNRELTGEIAALRHYDGRGACRLLEADAEEGALLLERLRPGRLLATLADDDLATAVAAEVIGWLWQCSNDPGWSVREAAGAGFIVLEDWFGGFRRLRQRYGGSSGPLPERLLARAESLSRQLLSEDEAVVLHGDLHHSNLLESARGWLAIDPKGVIGPRGYELGPLLMNPRPGFLQGHAPRGRSERRVAILSERLGLDRDYLRAWGFCHAVLSAWWSLEDDDADGWQYSLDCAEIFAQA